MAAMASGPPVAAVRLGELKARSTLGEPLDASIALKPTAGETLGPECFRLGSARSRRLLLESRATFAVESTGGAPRLRMRTAAPINEPALLVRINAACPGGRATTRDYELLFEPRTAIARPVTQAPAARIAPPAAAAPAAAREPGFRSLPGDSLASLAAAIYPKDPAAREAYLQAMRRHNAAVASLGAEEPIPAGTIVVLPDLHEFAKTLPPIPAAATPRRAPAALPDQRAAPARPPAPVAEAATPVAKADSAKPWPKTQPTTAARPPLPAVRTPAGAPFALRLSAPELDLGRNRNVDERTRAQLRERRLALDADDKVAALLALKHSVKQLEGRVAELQLKLATSTAAAPKDATPAPARAASAPVAAAPAPTTPAPKSVEPTKPAPQPAAATPPAKPAAQPAESTPPAKAAAPASPPAPIQAPAPAKAPEKAPSAITARTPEPGLLDDIPAWLWGLLAALVAFIGALGWLRFRRRDTPREAGSSAPAPVSELDEAEALMRAGEDVEPVLLLTDNGRAVADSDAGLATRIGGTDPATLRKRYIEERFPEIAGGTIVLDDPDSVVKAARLLYEDGALPRAVELLQFAIEEQPSAMKPWLALFEIFRLEALAGEFGALAARFREHHAASENWQKVQFIGRELDPQNPLYHDAPQAHLESIGALQAARAAAVTFDPLSENWLNAPMDFTSDALAATLRSALLADAGMQESDLAQDPMPALKNVEMFNVA